MNLDPGFRKPVLYPLSYGGTGLVRGKRASVLFALRPVWCRDYYIPTQDWDPDFLILNYERNVRIAKKE